MVSYMQRNTKKRGVILGSELLLICFAVWPLFWNLWVSFRYTVNLRASFPREFLLILTIIAMLSAKRLGKSFLYVWLIYFASLLPSVPRSSGSILLPDILIIVCGFLFCLAVQQRNIDTDIVIRCIYLCGLFVAVTVLIGAITNLFRTSLLSLYTDSAQNVMLRSRSMANGGIVPYTASAGCFICSGLGAFYTLQRQKRRSILTWAILAVFVLAFFLLQKRGFVLDIVLALFVIWILGWRFDTVHRATLNRQIRFVLALTVVAVIAVVSYYHVELFRTAVDSLLGRFSSGDETLSGRTLLYALAWKYFLSHPFLGIGWGRYRRNTAGIFNIYSTSTYEVHNVYLQLLCETGIIGLTAFLIAVGVTLHHGIKKYRSKIKADTRDREYYTLQLGLYLQLFFLFYCLSGNPLYDYNFLITYFMGVLLTV